MRLTIGCLILAFSNVLWAMTPEAESLHHSWFDQSISPADDFYTYANGNWQKQNPIPPQYATWGTFSILQEKVQQRVHDMLIAAANGPLRKVAEESLLRGDAEHRTGVYTSVHEDSSTASTKQEASSVEFPKRSNKASKSGSIEQKIGDFYFSGMDTESINKLGITPLKPDFDRIDAIKNTQDLQNVMTYLQQMGVDVGFGFGSMQDFKNSEEMIGAAVQAGLGLPDRDYYLKEDEKFKQIRKAYIQYLTKMFQLLGDTETNAKEEADVVMKIETRLAKASMSQIQQRDPYAVYNMRDLAQLEKLTPHFSWPNYLNALGYPAIKRINIGMPDFFKTFDQLLQSTPIDEWKTYLRSHLVDSYAPYLSKPFVDQQFVMTSTLTGAKELLPRWKRVVNTEEGALGFAIGKMYVEKYFPPSSKKEVVTILHHVREALRNDLKSLNWMALATRKAALKKLDLMGERVGYPSKWWDYSKLTIDRGPYVLNVKRANQFLIKRDLNKIGKPIDKTEWAMTPQTINAYYDPSLNNINIPAGILQPPFFDPKAPDAVNYGAIGFVIGHEITHGFDDQGAQFDGHGNLKNWWTAEDLKKFKAATHCIAEQFSKYKVNGDLSVQGKLVVGEATADLGGVILAYRAFHESDAYKQAKTINGFTPDQQFFIGVAHVWATNIRPEQMRNLVTVDPHPPMIYRVNGTLANMPQFQKAFEIADKSPMVNVKRCVIW